MQEFTVKLTLEQANIIRDALFDVKYRVSAPVIQALDEQIFPQIEAAQKQPKVQE